MFCCQSRSFGARVLTSITRGRNMRAQNYFQQCYVINTFCIMFISYLQLITSARCRYCCSWPRNEVAGYSFCLRYWHSHHYLIASGQYPCDSPTWRCLVAWNLKTYTRKNGYWMCCLRMLVYFLRWRTNQICHAWPWRMSSHLQEFWGRIMTFIKRNIGIGCYMILVALWSS